VEVISAPGVVAGFFSGPGQCAVVRAEQPGRLSVKVMRQSAGASIDATFRLEPVLGGERPVATVSMGRDSRATPSELTPSAASLPKLRLLAHVSRRGDLEVDAGEWVAGPVAPAPIEGVEIRGALPSGLRLDVQPLVSTTPPRWLDWTPAGVFAGSRGRSLPLAGLKLRLSGGDASRFVICADALFLGSPVVSRRGVEVEFVSSAGGDPLVGLKLGIEPVATMAPDKISAMPRGTAIVKKSEPRVRVFRAALGQ
jgi:hypothetical protein